MRARRKPAPAPTWSTSAPPAVFAWQAGTPRILASNTKLFTSSAALARFGTDGTLGTEVLGDGQLDESGVWRGNLYLRGGGDPTFGVGTYTRKFYGGGATVQQLAKLIDQRRRRARDRPRLRRRVAPDSLRGGPDSGYGVSIWVGPLSALSYNRGLANESGSAFQTNPPAFAAARLDDALEARGIAVSRKPSAAPAPRAGSTCSPSVDSPPMARIVKLMDKPSDNFFAELLAKDIACRSNGRGTTSRAPRWSPASPAAGLRARLVDGSGLSRGNRASPVPRRPPARPRWPDATSTPALLDALPIAGRDGTLDDRDAQRSGPRPLPGQDRDAAPTSARCRATARRARATSRLLVPDEPRLPTGAAASRTGWRRRSPRSASGAGGAGGAARRLSGSSASSPPRRGPRSPAPAPCQLRAGVLAGHQVVRLLRHRAGHLAAAASMRSVA